jgi:hypothetical protein
MTPAQADSTAVATDGLYVYCVARCDEHRVLGPIGLDGQMVYTVCGGGIRAVVHACPAQPYKSQDPQTVERWVVAHQAVVLAATGAFGTVLPMAFDMIVRGGQTGDAALALKNWLDEKRERFGQLLDKLAGKAEFGVQVFWDREAIAASLLAEDCELRNIQDEARGKPKGLAHILQQKLAKVARAKMERHADLLAQDFYSRIRRCVDDVRVEKLRKDDDGRQMLLNISCLMREDRKELGLALDAIKETPGVSVRFTGPWPPYSFVGQ